MTNIYVSTNGNDTEQTYSIATRIISVTNATQATNCQITTSTPHGLGVGEHVIFRNIGGMTQLNSTQDQYETGTHKFVYGIIDDYNFTLTINSTGFSAYTSGGDVRSVGIKRTAIGEVTSEGHKLTNGQLIYISGVAGSTGVNGTYYYVSDVQTNSFKVKDTVTNNYINWAALGGYTSPSGTITLYYKDITGITNANPAVVTCVGHNLSNGDYCYINDVAGMTEVNGKCFQVANKTADTFELLSTDSTGYGTYTSGGKVRRTYLLINSAISSPLTVAGDEIRVQKTTAITQYTSANCTWTFNTSVINTSASLIGSISAGDIISRSATPGNGNTETAYRVSAVASNSITIEGRYIGTTGTDTASIYKINFDTTMTPAAGIMININKSVTVSGGWDVLNDTQNGETWLKHSGSKTVTSNRGAVLSIPGATLSKINLLEAYYLFEVGANNTFVENCSFISSYVYTSILNYITYCTDIVFGCNGGASWTTLRLSANCIFSNVYLVPWNSASSVTMEIYSAGNYDLAGIIMPCSAFAVNHSSISNSYIKNLTTSNCIRGLTTTGSVNCLYENINIQYATIGIYVGTTVSNHVYSNCTLKFNTSYGIFLTQTANCRIEECEFASNNIDVYLDQYSGNIYCIGNSHLTPTVWAYSKQSTSSGSLNIIKCDIDSPSIAKAYQIIANDSYIYPQYNIQESFGGLSGKIYGKAIVNLDKTLLTSSGKTTVRLNVFTAISTSFGDFIVDAVYVNTAVPQTLTYILQSTGAWTGTITPKLKLNGITKVTGTSITSISNGSWDTHTITISSGLVTEDGLLTLEFNIVGNTTPVNAAVTSVT